MAIERKGGIVQRMKDARTLREGAVRLDRANMTFFARIPDEDRTIDNKGRKYFESKDGAEVESWLRAELKKQEKEFQPQWIGMIEVHYSVLEESRYGRRRHHENEDIAADIDVSLDRRAIALNHDQTQWLSLAWDACFTPESNAFVPPEDRIARAREYKKGPKYSDRNDSWSTKGFKLPQHEDGEQYLEYTEELWLGLNEVVERIRDAGRTLEALVGTKKGLKQIAEVGAGVKRLTAGTMSVEENA